MLNALSSTPTVPPDPDTGRARPQLAPKSAKSFPAKDLLEIGKTGLAREETGRIVLERAMNQLRGVVDEARAALGLEVDQPLDTSEEATSERILSFALGFFGRYAENNGLADDEEGRGQFAAFIGAAIERGISEAEGILGTFGFNGTGGFDISKTRTIIQERLADFVANGL